MRVKEAVNSALDMMRASRWDDAIAVLNDVLNAKMQDPWLLLFLGTCYQKKGYDGLSYALLLEAMNLKPDFFEAMVNICPILRASGQHDKEVEVWKVAEQLRPDHPDLLHNIAGAFLNNSTPEIAEKYALRSISKEGKRPDTLIQLALAYLEQERFGEGFDTWDEALTTGERKHRNFWSRGQTPTWDGTPGQRVMIYGEQGHGDEIMFASCMAEVMELCSKVYIDTSKRDMVPLYERSWPAALVSCTPDSQQSDYHSMLDDTGDPTRHGIDAMIAFGSLPTLFRRRPEDFPTHDGYLVAHPAKKQAMRERLDALGEGLKIGLAWKGGAKETHACYRTIDLVQFAPLLKQNAHFISVQYTRGAEREADIQQDQTGVPVHHWQPVISDFDMLTALIDELDLVISVPQTAVHQRAALGKECWVLTPYKVPWTFGLYRDEMIWYPKQTRLFRQRKEHDGNWTPTILNVARELSQITDSPVGPVIIDTQPSVEELHPVRQL